MDGLARVPDLSASHVAGAILINVRDLHAPPKAHRLLNLATSSTPMLTAAKNAWLQCSEANKYRMGPEMEPFSSTVAKFGSATRSVARDVTPQPIEPHITANAEQPGVNWTSVALQVAGTPAFLLTACAALHTVTDAASFRGIHQHC